MAEKLALYVEAFYFYGFARRINFERVISVLFTSMYNVKDSVYKRFEATFF